MKQIKVFILLCLSLFCLSVPSFAQSSESCSIPSLEVTYTVSDRGYRQRLDGSARERLQVASFMFDFAYSPSGTWLSFIESNNRNQTSFQWLKLKNTATGEIQELVPRHITHPVLAWSPVEDILVYSKHENGRVEIWMQRMGETAQLIDSWNGNQIGYILWSPDGAGFIYHREGIAIYYVSKAGERRSVFPMVDWRDVRQPQWLEDGSILLWTYSDYGRLYLLDVHTAQTRVILREPSFPPNRAFAGATWLAYSDDNMVIVLDKATGEFRWNIFDSNRGRFRAIAANGDELLLVRTATRDSLRGDVYLANLETQTVNLVVEDIDGRRDGFPNWLDDESLLIPYEGGGMGIFSLANGASQMIADEPVNLLGTTPIALANRYLAYSGADEWLYVYDMESHETCSVARTSARSAWRIVPEDSQ